MTAQHLGAIAWNVPSHGISTAGPIRWPTRSRISRALLVKVTHKISDGHASRSATRLASRAVSAAVLPVPAPASISTGPSVVSTASRWGGLRRASQSGSVA
jgi:hypothetical protein